MKEQDLYDRNCAKSKADKAAKERAEREKSARENARKEHERQERERRQREDQNRRSYQQNNRSTGNSSSSSGSSRRGNHNGSWNNNANSYFKDCKNKTELKRRYRQLCKKLHPDNPGGNTDSFCQMLADYESQLNKTSG